MLPRFVWIVRSGSPKIPTSIEAARRAADRIRQHPNAVPLAQEFAALAIESGSEPITTDRNYARLSGLRWLHPFEST